MTPQALKKYERLYANPRYMGAAKLLRRFLDFGDEFPVPLSVSHGVDFGHCHQPMDVDSIEPIHWSCNRVMHGQALASKPSVLIPHPWAITASAGPPRAVKAVLVVGPPPSPENDERLYQLIKQRIGPDWAVLVKARGKYERSVDFWRSRGLETITAHGPDGNFYERLFGILSRFETVIGCTFSSALVFAASIGRKVDLLRDYFYEAYEAAQYEDEVNFGSQRAREYVKLFINANRAEVEQAARTLLGFDLLDSPSRVRADLVGEIEKLERPFYANPRNPIPYWVKEFAALRFGKPGVLRHSPTSLFRALRRRHMCIMRINETDVWLNGKNATNFRLTPVQFVKGLTEPGQAPRGYGPPAAERMTLS